MTGAVLHPHRAPETPSPVLLSTTVPLIFWTVWTASGPFTVIARSTVLVSSLPRRPLEVAVTRSVPLFV